MMKKINFLGDAIKGLGIEKKPDPNKLRIGGE
jgi:hypothetical protein